MLDKPSKQSTNKDLKKKFYEEVMPKIYGIGASIVITGAMFKLLNWSGGGFMLGLGLTTEAIIFLLSAFEPSKEAPNWEKVYPELSESYKGPPRTPADGSLGEKLDDIFAQAKIDAALVEKLGKGMQYLSDSVAQMSSLSSATLATEQYVKHVEKASETLVNMNEAWGTTLNAINTIVHVPQNIKDYQEQMQDITKSLNALNSLYKKEAQEASTRFRVANELHSNIANAMEGMQEAGTEALGFKAELAKLTEKLASLNGIYSNMLTALKS
ncbi:MAG: gliding motility protein GldL [Cytophagales bacterium]|nr:gliding motility protein GldL [Cytophagales bacterium]